MPQPNWLVTVGLAKETTWGTAVNPPTVFLSCPKPVFTTKQESIFDIGLRGIRAEKQGLVFGTGHEEIDLPDMPWYGDDSGHLSMAMLGADAVSVASTKTGTIASSAVGATSLTYTVVGGAAPVTGDAFKIDSGLPTQEVVVPTLIAGGGPYTFTVPAMKYAHASSAPAAGLNTHTQTLLNTGNPPSWTAAKYDALNSTNARQSAGVYFEELSFKFANPGALLVSAKARGKMATNAAKGTAAYSVEPFGVPWQAAIILGGVANARIVDIELSLKAPVDQIFGISATQNPTAAIVDQFSVNGKFTVVPDDYTEFNYYLNNTQPACLIAFDNGTTRTDFQMSKLAFLDPTVLEHGGNYSLLNASFEAIANATDAGTGNSPLKMILRNLRTAVY